MRNTIVCIHHENDWESIGNTFVRGHAFINGEFYTEKEFCRYISELKLNEIREIVENVEGYFSIIKTFDDSVFAATDRVGSMPLFYKSSDNRFIISDSSKKLRDSNKLVWDRTALIEYLLFRFPIGNSTLLRGVNQMRAGEYLIAKNDSSLLTKKYYTHTLNVADKNPRIIKIKLEEKMQKIMNRMKMVADQKQIILPLSGGYDSRLLITMLDQSGINNVKTYTVATKNGSNPNLETAQSVAEQFDFEWKPVYVSQSDYREFIESGEWIDFNDFSGAIGGLPEIMDLIAVRKLKDHSYVTSNAVFIPGHTAIDTGKTTPQYKKDSDLKKVAKDIFNSFHISWNVETEVKKNLIDSIRQNLQSYETSSPEELFERYRLEERRSKRILSHGMTYRYHGHAFWYPLQDPILMDFWTKVPNSLKNDKNIYKNYIAKKYSEATGESHRVAGQSRWKQLAREVFDDTIVYPILKFVHSLLNSPRNNHEGIGKYDSHAENGILPRKKYLQIQREIGGCLYGYKSVLDIYPLMIVSSQLSDPASDYELNHPPKGVITDDWIDKVGENDIIERADTIGSSHQL